MAELTGERLVLLQAIHANPKEDTPRLMYADYLDECSENDRDRATAEFIRAACAMKNGDRNIVMKRSGYEWLHANWHRLIPDTLALHHKPENMLNPGTRISLLESHNLEWERTGRVIWMRLGLPGRSKNTNPNKIYTCSTTISFWKGFVVRLGMWTPWGADIVVPVLKKEQPLLDPKVYNGTLSTQ